MKNLKNMKKELLSRIDNMSVLTVEEKKSIMGGQYSSEEECEADCGGWQTNDWPHLPGPITGSGKCHEGSPGVWDCYDS